MTEQEWRITISESIGRIESKLDNICANVEGHKKTLYGSEGHTGYLRKDRKRLKDLLP